MSRYFITGVAGFIGSKVAEMLINQGHHVHGIDNLNNYYDPILKLWRIEHLQKLSCKGQFQFRKCDVESYECLQAALEKTSKIDGVIHLAARAGVRASAIDPKAYLETNVLGTLSILELCRNLQIPKLVIASSSSVYGSHNLMPYQEDADVSRPLSPYAASKKAAEDLCFSYHHMYNLDISALRFFTVYGPSGRPDMGMFRFIRAIVEGQSVKVFGDGSQSRDFSYVEDIARGVIAALKCTGFRIFNLGANHPVKLTTVVGTIERLAGRAAIIQHCPPNPADVPATWANISRAGSELGWAPSTCLESGVENSLKWYIANRSWAYNL
jgi:UDP-glucuronate 4-epimerase